MLMRNVSPIGPMCFRWLMFSLSRPCELLVLLCFIASWTCVVVSVLLYPCIFGVALLMDLFALYVVFVCRKQLPHLGAWDLDHRCFLSSCCLFVLFCILCGRVRACSYYASDPLVYYCICMPSRWCVCWWVLWAERKRDLCLREILSSMFSWSL